MALITYGFWFYHELRNLVGVRPGKHHGDQRDSYAILHTTNYGPKLVKTSSYRLEMLRDNPVCVACGRVGELWVLQAHNAKERPHLALYAVGEQTIEWHKLSQDGLVLMTKDHIIPRSMCGPTRSDNLQTMCSICNGKKGNSLPEMECAIPSGVPYGKYIYRNYPADIVTEEQLWCVSGVDAARGGAGVLEWCTDKADARSRMREMNNLSPGRFQQLSAGKWYHHRST
jgi:5-methylcytosine-specific restriction endonuclease McrA